MKNNLPTIQEKYLLHLANNSISINSVAISIDVTRSHLWKVLHGKREISESIINKLNAHLDTDFGN